MSTTAWTVSYWVCGVLITAGFAGALYRVCGLVLEGFAGRWPLPRCLRRLIVLAFCGFGLGLMPLFGHVFYGQATGAELVVHIAWTLLLESLTLVFLLVPLALLARGGRSGKHHAPHTPAGILESL